MERVVPEQTNEDDPKDLRKKLENALAENATLKQQNLQTTTTNLVLQANLGHLNEYQQKALMSQLDPSGDLDVKTVLSAAKNLGYEPPAPTPPAPPQGQPQVPQVPDPNVNPLAPPFDPMQQFVTPPQPLGDPNQSQYQYPQQQLPGQPGQPPQYPGQPPFDPAQHPALQQAITGLSSAEQAQVLAARNSQNAAGAYQTALAAAQTPEQVMNVVRTLGPSVGINDADLME